jgi:Cu-Zn family superoxide dismutase
VRRLRSGVVHAGPPGPTSPRRRPQGKSGLAFGPAPDASGWRKGAMASVAARVILPAASAVRRGTRFVVRGDSKMNARLAVMPLAVAAVLLATGCSTVRNWWDSVAGTGGPAAIAELKPTQGNSTSGIARFEQRGNKVLVTAEVRGLKPNAEHGFHVHEKGDCSAPDAMSAGGHFNPAGKPHGHHGQTERHAGDMPNLKADANGMATLRFETDLITVAAGPASVIGRGLIVHRDPDDYKTQPTGNSGPRLACAVIVAAK